MTVRAPAGSGDVVLEVQNNTDVNINSIYLAKSAALANAPRGHAEAGSTAEAEVWGADLLGNAGIPMGERTRVPVPAPGRWDVRAVDADGRYQHIAGLKLGAGGRYILELYDANWRVYMR